MVRLHYGIAHCVTAQSLSMSSSLRRSSLSVAAILAASAMWAPGAPAHASTPAPASAGSAPRTHHGLLGGGDTGWLPDKDLGSLYTVTRSAGVQHVWDETDLMRRRVTGK